MYFHVLKSVNTEHFNKTHTCFHTVLLNLPLYCKITVTYCNIKLHIQFSTIGLEIINLPPHAENNAMGFRKEEYDGRY